MKEAYWGYWLVVLGVFIIVVLLLVQSFTTTNTQDYYLIKSITEAAMVDAVDYSYYRQYGEVKINKEKFKEAFLRRFVEEASITTTYDIEYGEIYEAPPKVTVKVSSKSNSFNIEGDTSSFDIVNEIDAILESQVTLGQGNESFSPVEVTYLLDRLDNDATLLNNLSDCKVQFTLGSNCKSDTEEELVVQKCGKPTTEGVANGLNANQTYCIANKKTDSTCTVTATYNQFKNTYCK